MTLDARSVSTRRAMRPLPLSNPPNPWASTDVQYLEEIPRTPLHVYEDASGSILSRNDSPDVGFRWTVNPYRGCVHGCAYCYSRPTHEYLSFGAGTDFDRKIMVKPRAAQLLREAFERPSWKGEQLVFSGVTDCYQPLEASYRLTRGLLEVCRDYRQPLHVITKAPLVERDMDLLSELNDVARVGVTVSIPFWEEAHARAVEPLVATPRRRVETIRRLAAAGIPVGVNVAPLIPGLGDEDMGRVLEAAAEAGARSAGWVMLRLPGPVRAVFEHRLKEALPLRAERVLHRVREVRGGDLYDSRFGVRGTGEGPYAEAMAKLFDATCKRLGLATHHAGAERGETTFRRPVKVQPQLSLF